MCAEFCDTCARVAQHRTARRTDVVQMSLALVCGPLRTVPSETPVEFPLRVKRAHENDKKSQYSIRILLSAFTVTSLQRTGYTYRGNCKF
jgi:hypothetical protein